MIGVYVPWSNDPKGTTGYVIDGNGCHIWVGFRNRTGHGLVCVAGKTRLVNRVRYEREVGPIPSGAVLDHFKCNNGAGGCCNPLHMRPASQRENLLRGDTLQSKNLAKTHCKRGHPLEGGNLYMAPDESRKCRECQRARNRAYRARKHQ